jgi:predicted transcriptional regulator
LEDQYHGDVIAQTLVEHKEQIKQEIMTDFVRSCLAEIKFTKIFITGNLKIEEAKWIADEVVQTLQLKPEN